MQPRARALPSLRVPRPVDQRAPQSRVSYGPCLLRLPNAKATAIRIARSPPAATRHKNHPLLVFPWKRAHQNLDDLLLSAAHYRQIHLAAGFGVRHMRSQLFSRPHGIISEPHDHIPRLYIRPSGGRVRMDLNHVCPFLPFFRWVRHILHALYGNAQIPANHVPFFPMTCRSQASTAPASMSRSCVYLTASGVASSTSVSNKTICPHPSRVPPASAPAATFSPKTTRSTLAP